MNAWANEGNLERTNDLYLEMLERSQIDGSLTPDAWTYRASWKATFKTNQLGIEEKRRRLQMVRQSMVAIGMKLTRNMKLDLLSIGR